ncbi:MAG: hypothetical protein ACI8VC_001505 [Candidatus Endobugula sp.]|jgi:hypothetical protein
MLALAGGNAVRQDQSLSFAIDIGVIGISNPNINLSSTGTNPAIQSALDTQLDTESRELKNSLDDVNIYPVVNLSLAYHF